MVLQNGRSGQPHDIQLFSTAVIAENINIQKNLTDTYRQGSQNDHNTDIRASFAYLIG